MSPEEAAVVDAARDYVREIENPAPDLLFRATLRDQLQRAVHSLEDLS